MRFRLILQLSGRSNELPLNYQYELSSWIFHLINNSDKEFAFWLHESGYSFGNRKFKFFTFSRLRFGKYSITGDRLIIESEDIELIISFLIPQIVEHFIIGLFKNQKLRIGDSKSSVTFYVRQIEKLPEVRFSGKMSFSSLSPLIISHFNGINKYAQYLSPDDKRYPDLFYNNLISKYVALAGFNNELYNKSEVLADHEFGFSLNGGARPKLIKIKAGKEGETYLRGYEYNFELTAPVELMKIGYYAGFGEKNSLGFGCVEVMGNKN